MRSDMIERGDARAPHRSLLRATGVGEFVKQCVRDAGGVPFVFNTIGIDDGIAMGHSGMNFSLTSRELIADCVETMVQAHCFDGVICANSMNCLCEALGMALPGNGTLLATVSVHHRHRQASRHEGISGCSVERDRRAVAFNSRLGVVIHGKFRRCSEAAGVGGEVCEISLKRSFGGALLQRAASVDEHFLLLGEAAEDTDCGQSISNPLIKTVSALDRVANRRLALVQQGDFLQGCSRSR
jgi:hypothetical protein